jgi:hypothetical protein
MHQQEWPEGVKNNGQEIINNISKNQKSKNYFIMLCIVAFVILIYFVTIVRLTTH